MQTCQHGLDKVLKHCKHHVDYVDNCIIFSEDMETHMHPKHRNGSVEAASSMQLDLS